MALTIDKSKPIVQKITFSKQDQEDIDALLNGNITKEDRERHEKKGWNVNAWIGRRKAISMTHRINAVRKKYYKNGLCSMCKMLPEYNVIYKLEGSTLIERYCSTHLPKEYS